ncbi:mCG145481, partial [Mus musculus]
DQRWPPEDVGALLRNSLTHRLLQGALRTSPSVTLCAPSKQEAVMAPHQPRVSQNRRARLPDGSIFLITF